MHKPIHIKDPGKEEKNTIFEAPLTYPVDVFHCTRWQIVIDDHIHSFEVNPSSQQGRADEHPDLPSSEAVHYLISLGRQKKGTWKQPN